MSIELQIQSSLLGAITARAQQRSSRALTFWGVRRPDEGVAPKAIALSIF